MIHSCMMLQLIWTAHQYAPSFKALKPFAGDGRHCWQGGCKGADEVGLSFKIYVRDRILRMSFAVLSAVKDERY